MKVAVVGATGETGGSIINGLLEHPFPFEITAFTRHSSLQSSANEALRARGINVQPLDLTGDHAAIVTALTGVETLISAVNFAGLVSEPALAAAAKTAGVARFVPCFFATVAPPKNVLVLRDVKEDNLNHIKKLRLPYTVLDIGWWYQGTLPLLPSKRNAYAHVGTPNLIVGTGTVKSAHSDLADVGRLLARVILDSRTLNKSVFGFGELISQTEVYDIFDRLSGETIPRTYIDEETIVRDLDTPPDGEFGSPEWFKRMQYEYWHSWGVRGDNTPEMARYLGYLDARELYPDFKPRPLEEYVKEVLAGKAKVIYAEMRAAIAGSLSEAE
ncbi:Isoflavone reductase family protein [Colletotrichum higginsianum IMI 349063]|uniref:Isoflavone reductase family protein n=2 Tax=Colletotrichum higginsianum TaxID=80884 RepID=A0A1B7Y8J8_COLHI|nr:Isoflavone reductase family protein [Colletotrichum higginsianum IMI 349063]OBR08391.1 Isoflavone reductase family protein [Colletotrichum higginsianum IMI 349063]TIC95915.1 Isoflavone reductase-like protein [Colletotrichum higginsianum]